MRHAVLPSVSASAAICLAAIVGPLAGEAQAARAPAPALSVTPVNLHSGYVRFLPQERNEPRGISYARGHHAPPVSGHAAAACSEPHCPVPYHGGDVQHKPKLYLLLWGPKWSPTGPSATYLSDFLSGLGVEPQDTWSTTTEQYTDATGRPTFSGSVLQGVFEDTSTPPHGTTQSELAAEADAFYSGHHLTDQRNSQIVVATQTGTCPQGFAAPGPPCNSATGDYCAWHSYSSVHGVPFTNLPYMPDAGGDCGQGFVNNPGTYDGYSIVEGHEYAESTTDPFPDSGWIDLPDPSGGEIADKCAWTGLADVTLSTGMFAMQPLWSNSANRCVQSTPITITTRAFPTGTVGEAYTATAVASGGTAPDTWSRISGTKPPGLSFSAAGVWSGTPTAAGIYSFTLKVTDHSGKSGTKVMNIRVKTLAVTTTSFAAGTVGEAYHAAAAASSGPTPYTWSRIAGSKPPGLSFSTAGVWSGTPTATGTYSFTLQVTDHFGTKATRALSIKVATVAVTTTSFPSGTVGHAYHATATASGGTRPYTWSRIAGSKPPGLSFSAAGVWSGTPSAPGTYSFTIRVTDHLGKEASKALKIVIGE